MWNFHGRYTANQRLIFVIFPSISMRLSCFIRLLASFRCKRALPSGYCAIDLHCWVRKKSLRTRTRCHVINNTPAWTNVSVSYCRAFIRALLGTEWLSNKRFADWWIRWCNVLDNCNADALTMLSIRIIDAYECAIENNIYPGYNYIVVLYLI